MLEPHLPKFGFVCLIALLLDGPTCAWFDHATFVGWDSRETLLPRRVGHSGLPKIGSSISATTNLCSRARACMRAIRMDPFKGDRRDESSAPSIPALEAALRTLQKHIWSIADWAPIEKRTQPRVRLTHFLSRSVDSLLYQSASSHTSECLILKKFRSLKQSVHATKDISPDNFARRVTITFSQSGN